MSDPTAMSARRAKAPVPEQVDIAIVGAGMGGLTAGAYLAQSGLKVAVFDSHYVAGGCCTQFGRGSGDDRYTFDIGLHYIGDCAEGGPIPKMLGEVGIDDIEMVPMDQDGFDTLVFPDFRFRIPASHDVYRDRLVEMFPQERKGIDRYVRFLKEVEHMGKLYEKSRGKLSASLAVNALLRGRMLMKYQKGTIEDLLDSCTQDPKLRAVMLGQHGDYGLPPSEVAAVLHAGLANHYFAGAYYPRGGGQILADRLAETIEANGGSVHLRKPIEEIVVESGRAVGLRTEANRRGEFFEVRAKTIVSNADLRQTFERLVAPEHLPSKLVAKSKGYKMGGAIFMTCLGVTADMAAKGMSNTNYWQMDSYDFESYYRDSRAAGEPRVHGCYITSASFKDPYTRHCPEGVTSIEVMSLVPGQASAWDVDQADVTAWRYKRSERYKALKGRIEEQMIGRLEALFPGTRETIVFQESATPVTHSRYTRASDGSGYGLACSPDQYMENRPGYRTPVKGLYLAGASTRAGHGVLGAMFSGHHAAHVIARDLGRELVKVTASSPRAAGSAARLQPAV